jgi:predicted nucleotidyltransferase
LLTGEGMPITTLTERKTREARRRAEAARAIVERLRAYVQSPGRGGRFIVFGSAAAGTIRHGSDFDVIVDFPPAGEAEVWRTVENACAEWNLPADILSTSTTAERFVKKIMARPVEVIE